MQIETNFIDVFSREIYPARIWVEKGKISMIERIEKKCKNYLMPGFVDAHIHIESSMVSPAAFAEMAMSHGTVGVVSDPHEIANVLGIEGVDFMVQNSKETPLKIAFGAPSCVPATTFETSGASLGIEEIKKLFDYPEINYLSEVMNYPGVVSGDRTILGKIAIAKEKGYPVDGHAPGLRGKELEKYIQSGISTDHECFSMDEALEKISNGMKIQIREGSGAKNLNELMDLIATHPDRIMFCSDDLHPDDLLKGHINKMVKTALDKGYDLFNTLRAASVNAVEHYGLNIGLCRVNDPADFVIIDSPEQMNIMDTYIDGIAIHPGKNQNSYSTKCPNSFNVSSISKDQYQIVATEKQINVIKAIDGELITEKILADVKEENGYAVSDTTHDILKIAVINRYEQQDPAMGFISGFGLKRGAIGSSIGHDSHNIICVGATDNEIAETVNWMISNKGGIAVHDGKKVSGLNLEIAGIMSAGSVEYAAKTYSELTNIVKELGSGLFAPFMTLSFMALLVIPELKMSDKGLFNGKTFSYTSLFVNGS